MLAGRKRKLARLHHNKAVKRVCSLSDEAETHVCCAIVHACFLKQKKSANAQRRVGLVKQSTLPQ